LNTATEHPLSVQTTRAMKEYLDALTNGPDSSREKFEDGRLMTEVRQLFAKLINAKPAEIGFTPSTQNGREFDPRR
jgi:selenocysteine lyase/cysteine desulfurase